MAYLRSKDERLTCFQEAAPYSTVYAPKADQALVYGLDDSLPERLRQYQAAGYHCAVMLAISWGGYRDYLDGAFDGESHRDEGQIDRSGKALIHNVDVPYLVPTDTFCDYLIERLKLAVDAGAEGVVIEEPEFNAAAGYSQAFRRAYEQKYAEPFAPQHEGVTAAVRCAHLKADLYAEAIRRVAAGAKAYAKAQGKPFFVTVATHSVINYSQWQIVSPVGQVGLMPEADALIAQVWTGTSRTAQVHDGRVAERVFETAFMEYASLIAAAGEKPVCLLTDPIEDSLSHSWEMYQKNYIDTLLAALMQPGAQRFELCPWPKRVFCGQYPRVQPAIGSEIERGFAAGLSKAIPRDYASLLCGIFELMGDLPEEAGIYEGGSAPLGFLLSDSCLYERLTPDTVPCDRLFETEGFKLLTAFRSDNPGAAEACSRLLKAGLEGGNDEAARLNAFKGSSPTCPMSWAIG